MRRAAKVDANQQAIVEALRAAGASVQSLAPVGSGCPDLAVGIAGKNYLIECKAGSGFRPSQKKWHTEWRGTAHVANSVADALLIIGAKREETV